MEYRHSIHYSEQCQERFSFRSNQYYVFFAGINDFGKCVDTGCV